MSFGRRTLPPRVKSIPQRGTGRGRIGPVGDAVVAQPKGARVLDEGYRRWVVGFPCLQCGVEGYSQAAHPNQGRGKGQKADDTDCFPLCCDRPGVLGCHTRHDQLYGLTLSERREREKQYIETMRAIATIEGRKANTL